MRIGIVVSSEIVAVFQDFCHLPRYASITDDYEITEYRPKEGLILNVINAGNGNINSALATQALINWCHPDCIAHYGLAINLGGAESFGEIYLVDDVIHYDFNATTVGEYPEANTPLIALDGRNIDWTDAPHRPCHTVCLSGDTLVRTPEQFKYIKSIYPDAKIADLNSAGVSIACRKAGVPCLIVKTAKDPECFFGKEEYENDYFASSISCFRYLMDIIYWLCT